MGNSSNKYGIPKECLRPQGLYGDCEWDEKIVKRMILQRKLAPCFVGAQECGDKFEEEECPVCLLFYPGGLNRAICCNKPICTECYLQIQKPRQHHARCPFCNHQPYLVEFTGLRSHEEVVKEEEEEQKVLALKIKMQKEQDEASRSEQQQRRKEETANRAAAASSSSAVPVELGDIVLEPSTSHPSSSAGNTQPRTPLRPIIVPHAPAASPSSAGAASSSSTSSHHARTASNSSTSSTGTNTNTSSANRVTRLPAMYKDFVPSTATGFLDDQAMLDEAIRLSLLDSESTSTTSSKPVFVPAPPSSSNQPNIFFSSFNFVTNVNITAPQPPSSSSSAATSTAASSSSIVVEGASANAPENNPFQLHNSTHFRIPSASNSSSIMGPAAPSSSSTVPPDTNTVHHPTQQSPSAQKQTLSGANCKIPPVHQAPPAAATSNTIPDDAGSSSSVVALDDEETQLQVAIALSLSLLDEQPHHNEDEDEESDDDSF